MFAPFSGAKAFKPSSSFVPTFSDQISVDPSIVALCKNSSSCIADVLISGLSSMGLATQSGLDSNQNSISQLSKLYTFINKVKNRIYNIRFNL